MLILFAARLALLGLRCDYVEVFVFRLFLLILVVVSLLFGDSVLHTLLLLLLRILAV